LLSNVSHGPTSASTIQPPPSAPPPPSVEEEVTTAATITKEEAIRRFLESIKDHEGDYFLS
jgi:hypothetical protein